MPRQIRILLADDHNIMRRGLRLLLEREPGFTVAAEAADGRQAVEQALAMKPDVAVLDIAMPNLSGIEAAQRIAEISPETAVVSTTPRTAPTSPRRPRAAPSSSAASGAWPAT